MEGLFKFYIAGTLFSLLLVMFILYYIFLHQKKVNQYNLRLKEHELKKQNELLVALTEGEQKERIRLAEELHDGIGAKLAGLNMSLEYISNQPHADVALLKQINTGLHETINEIREISQNLKPSSLFSKGLNQTLAEYVAHLNKKSTCHYDLYIENIHTQISQELQFVLYRIISELLNNINKHAQATQASVQVLFAEENILQIIAEDNGIGFRTETGSVGIGMSNIKNRIMPYKGQLNIDSSEKGSTIIIEIPIV